MNSLHYRSPRWLTLLTVALLVITGYIVVTRFPVDGHWIDVLMFLVPPVLLLFQLLREMRQVLSAY